MEWISNTVSRVHKSNHEWQSSAVVVSWWKLLICMKEKGKKSWNVRENSILMEVGTTKEERRKSGDPKELLSSLLHRRSKVESKCD